VKLSQAQLSLVRSAFDTRLEENVSLKRYTAARIGGNADAMLTVESADELAQAVKICWENNIPFFILGSGSNILVSDLGVRELVLLNHAKKVVFEKQTPPISVFAESGTNFGALARKAASLGLSGLEWAEGIPGTLGGAVYGNAGAHGADMASNLLMANILHLKSTSGVYQQDVSQEEWSAAEFEYGYRTSRIKRQSGRVVVLSARLMLNQSTPEKVQAEMEEIRLSRHNSQPTGASLGSIFKNPPGDYAGRLIEATGLKGVKVGNVEVSRKHANFFINRDNATAQEYASLIKLVQDKVFDEFGIRLDLEIEFVGEWTEPYRYSNG